MGMCVDCDKLKCEVCSSMGRHPAGRSVESPEELGWALATAGRLGEERERERIIKLLEGIYDYPQGWDYDNPIESVIALIKGENTEKAEVHTSADNTITKTHCEDCNDWGCHGCSCDDVEDYCATCGKGENK